MQPIGTWKDEPLEPIDESGDAGVTAPNSGITAPPPSACSVTDPPSLEDTLHQCETQVPRAADVPPIRDRLEVKVVAGASTTTPGGRVEVQVTLRNTGDGPLPLYFTGEPAPRFEIDATDTRGRRVDLPSTKWPGYPKGHKPEPRVTKAARITLEKNGIARVRLTWEAVKTRWAPDRAKTWEGRGYPRVHAGPLPAGKYLLRVVVPVVGDVEVPRVPIDVL
jgi:hypothetical protein